MELRPWKWFDKTSDHLDVVSQLDNIKLHWQLNREDLGLGDADLGTTPISVSSARAIKRLRQSVMKYITQVMRGSFEAPEWDFSTIDQAVKKESLLRRSIEKYVEQIWKNGFEFTGKNANTVNYIRKRFRQINQVSGISALQLFQQIAYSLVVYANVIIVKKRNEQASGGKIRTTFDNKMMKPIAAYFVVSPTSIIVDKDEFGVVRRWKQKPLHMFANKTPEWRPDDVIFFKDNSATDSLYFFSMPMALPVIPDIKALRETEELAILQAIKFSTPRYHAKIGEKGMPGTQQEIDAYAGYLDSLPTDSVIVTSARVEIGNVAEGDQVLDLTPYLSYWWQRILSGLGMSKVGMGDGSTANRSTAQTMTGEMQNTTIKFQQLIRDAIENYMIRELLLELGYTEETLSEENMVHLHIPEIDLDNKIKKENHNLQLFMGNGITHTELRNELGRDKISDSEKDELYSFMITQELAEHQSNLDAQTQAAKNKTDNKDRPANQHGTQNAKPKISKDYLSDSEPIL
ncbi:hypothetical protein [Acinetobacter sp.]|uniref:hypothetical protein n=1 Tax=Acinetobacter sp. TaxID=472 RepID=UPI003D009265